MNLETSRVRKGLSRDSASGGLLEVLPLMVQPPMVDCQIFLMQLRMQMTKQLQSVSKSLPSGPNIDIVDASVDDELDFKKEPAASSRTKSHPHAREALLNTDFNVFKYPWEKGRLKKFFSNEPVVKLPVPKLKPGGRCGLA